MKFEGIVNVAQAASILGISQQSVRRYARIGDLPTMPIPATHVVLFDKDDVYKFAEKLGSSIDASDLLSMEQVADRLGMSYEAIKQAAHQSRIVSQKVKGRRMFRREDVEAFAAKRGLVLRGEGVDQVAGRDEGEARK